MKKNMGVTDRAIRLIIAIALAVLFFTHVVTGTLAVILLVVAAVFTLTAFINFCPLYTLLGISSRKKN